QKLASMARTVNVVTTGRRKPSLYLRPIAQATSRKPATTSQVQARSVGVRGILPGRGPEKQGSHRGRAPVASSREAGRRRPAHRSRSLQRDLGEVLDDRVGVLRALDLGRV